MTTQIFELLEWFKTWRRNGIIISITEHDFPMIKKTIEVAPQRQLLEFLAEVTFKFNTHSRFSLQKLPCPE